jgi:hypothetical protein
VWAARETILALAARLRRLGGIIVSSEIGAIDLNVLPISALALLIHPK